MDTVPDETIFDARDRECLEVDASLRAFSGITKAHVAGLLSALGEYTIRSGGPERLPQEGLGLDLHDREFVQAHRTLVTCFLQTGRAARDAAETTSQASQAQGRPDIIGSTSGEQRVFNPRERQELSLYKYIRRHADITRQELMNLLVALSRYSLRAKQMVRPGMFELMPDGGLARKIHAHNALLGFRDAPFTFDEFGDSVRTLLRQLRGRG